MSAARRVILRARVGERLLGAIRAGLRARMRASVLGDPARFTRIFAAALRGMARREV